MTPVSKLFSLVETILRNMLKKKKKNLSVLNFMDIYYDFTLISENTKRTKCMKAFTLLKRANMVLRKNILAPLN